MSSKKFTDAFVSFAQTQQEIEFNSGIVENLDEVSVEGHQFDSEATENDTPSRSFCSVQLLDLLDSDPVGIQFSDLAEKMVPINVPDFPVQGIIGHVEDDLHFIEELLSTDERVKTEPPPEGAFLWLHMAQYVENSRNLITNTKKIGMPTMVVVDDTHLMPGVLAVCRYLRPGQRGKFLLPPETMYGKQGVPMPTPQDQLLKEGKLNDVDIKEGQAVPPSATILFLAHSLKWIDAGASARYYRLDDDSKKTIDIVRPLIEGVNETGFNYCQRKKYKKALEEYKTILSMLDGIQRTAENKTELQQHFNKTNVNLAICLLKLDSPEEALEHLNLAAKYGNCESNCKYQFNRGKCNMLLNRYEVAMEHFMKALTLEPYNELVGIEITKIDRILAENKKIENNLCKQMLGGEIIQSNNDELEKIKASTDVIIDHMRKMGMKSVPLATYNDCDDVNLIQQCLEGTGYKCVKKPSLYYKEWEIVENEASQK